MATLKCIREQDKNQGLVLIFVHGLGGDSYQTWMHNPKDDNTLWPRWLAEDCQCSVWTLGYDASLSAWHDSAMPLPDQGDNVLDCLVNEPKLKNRRLLLIGHSLGGLLIKTVIVSGCSKGVPRSLSDRPHLSHIGGYLQAHWPMKTDKSGFSMSFNRSFSAFSGIILVSIR